MSSKIWTIAFKKDDQVTAESLELIDAARKLNPGGVSSVETALFCAKDDSSARQLGEYGVDKVFLVEHPDFENFYLAGTVDALIQMAEKYKPDVILLPSDVYGKELGPVLSAKLKASFLYDLISVKINPDGKVMGEHPVYGGKLIAKIASLGDGLQLASIRPHAFEVPGETGEAAPVEKFDYKGYSKPAAVVKEILTHRDRLDVSEASVIVSGGRGVKSAENFKMLEKLAEILNAAVGASRAAVDEGWRPHSDQIGQTGKTVAPELYVACGISGAVQHMAGVSRAKCIVAINKDPDAPIMKVADYAIQGDLFEIIPRLTEQLENMLKSKEVVG